MPVPLEQALQFTLEERGIAIEPLAESVARAVDRDRPGNGIVCNSRHGIRSFSQTYPMCQKIGAAKATTSIGERRCQCYQLTVSAIGSATGIHPTLRRMQQHLRVHDMELQQQAEEAAAYTLNQDRVRS
jgi:hypothetical protein